MQLNVSQRHASLHAVIAGGDATSRSAWAAVLAELHHTVAGEAPSAADALPVVRARQPDIVLLDIVAASRSLSLATEAIRHAAPRAAIVLASRGELPAIPQEDLVGSPVMGMLTANESLHCVDYALRLAVARARELADAKKEADASRRQLEERKTIERAKGMLMRRTGASEEEAYRILQRTSQDRSQPMIQIAQRVLETEGRPY